MLPPDQVGGYVYPPRPANPSGAPNNAFAAPPRGRMGFGGPGNSTPVPTTPPGDPYANTLSNPFLGPEDTLSNAIPDPMRVKEFPIRTEFPDPARPPQDFYLGVNGVGRDLVQRHSVESQKANAWEVAAPTVERYAQNPRNNLYPEGGNVAGFTQSTPGTVRPTARQSPNYYAFTRPYDQAYARRLNGSHFSMADHRRNYPVFGMAPAKTWRNTSRIDPAPWDANIVDHANPATTLAPQIPQYEAPMNSQQYVFGA